MINIKLNSSYRTRCGYTATVIKFDNTALRPFIATITGDGPDHNRDYTESGREYAALSVDDPAEESPYDLVEEIHPAAE